MPDTDWCYHLTTKQVAQKIKGGGMTSALLRIHRPVANPQGAFVKNRDKMEALKFEQKLKGYLADLLARGCAEQTIKGARGAYVPFEFKPEGDNAADSPRLTAIEKERLAEYMKLLKFGASDAKKRVKASENDKARAEDLAKDLLANDKNHFLARLAVQCVATAYMIEETITASHVYFLKGEKAKEGYEDYKKHLGNEPMVVLRVPKKSIPDLVDDDSDFRAVMTKHAIAADLIEVMENHDKFVNESYRADANNWKPLSTLSS